MFNRFILLLVLFVGCFFNVNAQDENEFADKYALISKIKQFLTDSTEYKTDTVNFYSIYSKPDEDFYHYVYVSQKDAVKPPKDYKPFYFFNNDSIKANQFIGEEQNKGNITYWYKTAGTSAARLNYQMLNYYNEEITFVLFHEATHQFVQKNNPDLPYPFNEALCDAMGLSLLKRFYKYSPDFINKEAVLNFEKSLTSIHRLNINALLELKEKGKRGDKVFEKLNEQLVNYTMYSRFLQDRYAGPVNMAWMLKNKYYSGAYFYCRMFTGFPSTKIVTKQLSQIFAKDKNSSYQDMVDKDLYLFMDN